MRLFYCYSTNLKRFLAQNNIRYLRADIHPKTNKAYWVYEGTEILNDFLEKWKVRKY